jgi:hypothetical protein
MRHEMENISLADLSGTYLVSKKSVMPSEQIYLSFKQLICLWIMIDSALSAMKLEVGNKGVRMSRDLDGKETIELL